MKVKQYRKILLLVLMICAAILFGCVERALGRQLSTQQIASEWSAEDSYAQISCFFSKDAAVTKDYVIYHGESIRCWRRFFHISSAETVVRQLF